MDNNIEILPENSIYYEMEEFMPSYIFVELLHSVQGNIVGRMSFWNRNDTPYCEDENSGIRWFEIDKIYGETAERKIKEIAATPTVCNGVTGYIVPLQESPFFASKLDVNAYLHNLMFWEGMIESNESGPLEQRLTYIVTNLYEMQNDMNRRLKEETQQQVIEQSKDDKADEISKYLEMIRILKATEDEMHERTFRNEMLRKQMEEMQIRMEREEAENTERQNKIAQLEKQLAEMLKALKQ